MLFLTRLTLVLILFAIALNGCTSDPVDPVAKSGDQVKIKYVGRLDNGEVFDSSSADNYLEFVMGSGGVIPGFDAAIEGMKVGQSKRVTIPADSAYGQRKDEMIMRVALSSLPEGMSPTVGQALMFNPPDGRQMQFSVIAVDSDSMTVDGNHALAGQNLTFDLELMGIEEKQ